MGPIQIPPVSQVESANSLGQEPLKLAYGYTTAPKWGTDKSDDLRKKERKKESEVAQSCPTLCDPMDSRLPQAPPSMGFSRQEYWSGLPLPSPDIEIKCTINVM